MVFNMLKGIRRLMLTTGLLCGVGLFLCAVDVKADAPSYGVYSVSEKDDHSLLVTIKDFASSFDSGRTFSGTVSLIDENGASFDTVIGPGGAMSDISVDDGADKFSFVIPEERVLDWRGTSKLQVKFVTGKIGSNEQTINASITDIVKVTAKDASSSSFKTLSSKYEIYNGNNEEVSVESTPGSTATAYLYRGEEYTVKSIDAANYYMHLNDGSIAWNDEKWKIPSSGYVGDTTSETNPVHEFVYLPKIKTISFSDSANWELYMPTGQSTVSTTIDRGSDFTVVTEDGDPSSADIAIMNMILLEDSEIKQAVDKDTFTFKYSGTTPGSKTIKLVQNGAGPDGTTPASSEKTVNIYAQPTALQVVEAGWDPSISEVILERNTYDVLPIKFTPAGANQSNLTDDSYAITATIKSGSALTTQDLKIETFKPSSSSDGAATIRIEALANAPHTGTATIVVTSPRNVVKYDDQEPKVEIPAGTVSTEIKVRIVEQIKVDSDKTKTAIKDANKNFITVGKTMGIEDLIKKYAKNSNGDSLDSSSISVSKIEIASGSDYLSKDGTRISGKKAGNATIDVYLSGNTSSTADIRGLEIEVNPNKTEAKYDADARTLKITAPEKIYYALDDSDNIRDVSSVKVILENSNGDNLADKTFDFSSSSSSSHTREYTVSASDIENLVATAASNGKFNSDSTSVKFKVIPRGKKQSGDDTVDAKEELQGKSDITTVYRLTASGTNFGTSYAYGLNGQTVKLTASPNSGYTFEKWSDGNTSNPREIKVSSSGTKTFTAIAKQSVNPTNGSTTNGVNGNGTGTNGDNSQLYDDVPKTAESNSAIWLIVFMVFAVMGTTYALYLQLRAATSKNDR